MSGERITLTRTGLGRLLSAVGGMALAVTAAGVAWQGAVTPFTLGTLLVGILGLGGWIAVAPDDFRDWITGRSARQGGNSLLATLFFIGLVAALYSWAAARNIAVDMTAPASFTLSPPVRDMLARLDRPVRLTGFYSGAALAQRERDDVIFHLFVAETEGLFQIVYVDPFEEPLLAERFGAQDGTAFLTFVDAATGEPDLGRIETIDMADAQERSVANALRRLLVAGEFKVYFTSGHGELDPTATGTGGISGIFDGIAAQGILTGTLDPATLAGPGVPEDATAVVIVGPRRRFAGSEVAALDAYLTDGGSLFIAADILLDPEDTFLDADDPLAAYLAERFGFIVHDDLVVDEANSFQSPINVIPAQLAPHAVMEGLGDTLVTIFFGSRSVEVVPYEGQPESVSTVGRSPLILSGDEAYGETDLEAIWRGGDFARDEADLAGPLALAAVAEDTESGARLILVGDADFLRNEPIGFSGNGVFYTQALDWLTAFSEQVQIPVVSDPTRLPLIIADETLTTTFLFTVLVMPGIVLLVGALVWRRRRQR